MAASVNTQTFFNAQSKVIKTIYSNTAPMKPLRYPTIFNQYKGDMDRSFFQVMPIVGFSTLAMRPQGSSPAIDAPIEGPGSAFPYLSYALQYIVTKEMAVEDAKKIIPMLPALLRYASDQTKEFLFWNVFNLAFSTAAPLAVDNLPLCSTSHPIVSPSAQYSTYSNSLGAVSLTVESLQQAFVLMTTIPDDRGLLTYRTPQSLIYPPGLHKTVVEVLQSFYYPTTAENRVNAVAGSVEPYAIEYLTAAATGPFPWFVLAGKAPIGADGHSVFYDLKWDNQQNTWVDQQTGNLNHSVEFRGTWGAINGRGIVGSQGA